MRQLQVRAKITAFSVFLAALTLVSALDAPLDAVAQAAVVPATEIALAPGESSALPAVTSGPNWFTLIGSADPPLLSALDAQGIVADTGIAWALSGDYHGSPVTITAIHGLATSGRAADTSGFVLPGGAMLSGGCVNWLGPCNYPVSRCMQRTQPGSMCVQTGEVIPRFENRPAWLIDLGGVSFVGSRTAVNHAVYLVDELTASNTFIWGYQGP